jgi:phosphopentomutase
MKRVILTVLDGVGVGELPDAANYGDVGSNTLAHVVKAARPSLPNMAKMGLGQIDSAGYPEDPKARGAFGKAREVSPGKDTTTGHWEMAGLRLFTPFPTYHNGFPPEVMDAFEKAIGIGTLGNKAASGTEIIVELGEEHLRTKKPIVYTSADSVFQIACHESIYPPEKLYEMCETARRILTGPHAVGRVIARPFAGEPGHFERTPRRRDFSLPPTGETLLDVVKAAGMDVFGVGKIEDIFCHRGLTGSNHAAGNPACIEAMLDYMRRDFTGLLFTNLVDTDMVYGHRNDPVGYAQALSYFDLKLPEVFYLMGKEDLLILTADHGVDPTFPGTDHTREHVPILCWHQGMKKPVDLGTRETFADIAATIAEYLNLPQRFSATSFLKDIL